MELLVLDDNNWNHLTVKTIVILVYKQISSYSFKNEITN